MIAETKGAWRAGLAGLLLAGLLLAGLPGCTVIAGPARYSAHEAGIPPGHRPPPGSCRIWYPDRPPGHQPPPGPCGILRYEVPPDAYLVHG